MKVLILSPPNSFEKEGGEETLENRTVPLDLATIGAVIKRECDVKILDALALKINRREIIDEVNRYGPDLIFVHPFDRCRWALETASQLINDIRDRKVGLIGGYNSDFILNVMKEEKGLDFATYGDPEYTLLDIVKKGRVEGVKGVIFRKGKRIVKGRERKLLDINDLPIPARELLDMKVYKRFPHENKTDSSVDVLLSRGCPYQCTFCLVKQLSGKRYRVRSVENVIKEIRFLMKKYKTKEFHFMDPVFTMNLKWVREFCRNIKPLNLEWSCQTRVDIVNEGVLKQMKEAGCFSILYGVESLNPELLKNIKKGITVEQVNQAVRLTKGAGIEARLSFMFGLPGETPEKAMEIIRSIIGLEPDFVQFHSSVAFPGTDFEKDIRRFKWGRIIKKVATRRYDLVGRPFVPSGYRNREEIEMIRKTAYRKFYMRPKYLLRLLLKPSKLWRYIKAFRIYSNIMKE